MSAFAIAQAIGALALAHGLISFQCKSRRAILFWLAGSGFTMAAHFFVLGEPTPGLFYAIMGSRSLIATFTTDRRVLCLVLALIVGVFLCGERTPLNYLGIVCTLLATCGCFQKRHERVRRFLMVAESCWFVHHVLIGSPVAALTEAAYLTSNLVGYWRQVM